MEEKETKICPFCGKEISIRAKKCKHCGKWLNDLQQKNSDRSEFDIKQPNSYIDSSSQNNEKICPYCCQKIPINAQKCQFCGEWLNRKPEKENSAYKACQIILGIIIVIVGLLLECASNGGGAGLVFAIVAIIAMGIYFLPTTIADNKRHKNTTAIFVVNLFFGYTIIGWVIALIWALTDEH